MRRIDRLALVVRDPMVSNEGKGKQGFSPCN